MWNKPTDAELKAIPPLYSTESTPLKEKVIHMHFFIGGCDWYAVEYGVEDQLFFGFAILNNDLEMAEWGYFSLKELAELRSSFVEVDRDLHWMPVQAQAVGRRCEAQGWGQLNQIKT